MNTISNQQTLPHLPTEIWDKIYDVKEALEIVDKHKSQLQPVIDDIREMFGTLTTNYLPRQTACGCCRQQCHEMLPPGSDGGYGYFEDLTMYGVCETCMYGLWHQYLQDNAKAEAYGEPGYDESWDKFIRSRHFASDVYHCHA